MAASLEVVAAGWSIPNAAVSCEDFLPLLSGETGDDANYVLDGVDGEQPLPERRGVFVEMLKLSVRGEVTFAGGVNADPVAGLEANVLALTNALGRKITGGDGTQQLKFHTTAGTTYTADCKTEFRASLKAPTTAEATLVVKIPKGWWS